jgi:hypothetical protein
MTQMSKYYIICLIQFRKSIDYYIRNTIMTDEERHNRSLRLNQTDSKLNQNYYLIKKEKGRCSNCMIL